MGNYVRGAFLFLIAFCFGLTLPDRQWPLAVSEVTLPSPRPESLSWSSSKIKDNRALSGSRLKASALSAGSFAPFEDNFPAKLPWDAYAPPLTRRDHQLYNAAIRDIERRKVKRGRTRAHAIENPIIRDLARWEALRRRHSGADFDDIARFLEAHPSWPGQKALRLRAEEILPQGRYTQRIIDWFRASQPQTIEGLFSLLTALRAENRPQDAISVLRSFWVNEIINADDEKRFLANEGRYLKPSDHRARMEKLIWQDHGKAARRMLSQVSTDEKKLFLACLKLMSNAAGVDKAIRAVPNYLSREPILVFQRLRWRQRNGLKQEASKLLAFESSANTPWSKKWWRERESLARDAIQHGDMEDAYQLVRRHRFTKGQAFAEAEFLSGWISLRFLRQPRVAYEHFHRLFQGVVYARSLARAAYWAGRAAEAANHHRSAEKWYKLATHYSFTYHGQLANARASRNSLTGIDTAPQATMDDFYQLIDKELTQAILALHALRESSRITPFFHRLRLNASKPEELILLIQLAEHVNRTDLALSAAKSLARGGTIVLDFLFPFPETIKIYNVEKALVLGMIRQESAFNPKAISRSGARGLMQLMPGTAKLMARALKINYSKDRLLVDPHYNIRLGQAYLRRMLERFNGSYLLAIAAYNAGPGRAQSWIQHYGDPRDARIDPIDWIETIPFRETRDYVQKVMEGMQVYRHRLQGSQLALFLDHPQSVR